MPHDVIMPALGMAQDTGLLIAWCKAPGDMVKAGDVLFEVETDKSTMEVEAAHDGYLAELHAKAGENVPVGEVIAVITAEKPDVPVQRPPVGTAEPAAAKKEAVADNTPLKAATEMPAARRAEEPAPRPRAPVASGHVEARAAGRILASPKARRLAAVQGLDLSRLVADGVQQPFHVADLERLKALPATSAPVAPAAAPIHLSAAVAAEGFDAFRTWLAAEVDAPVPAAAILASFLTGATRVMRDDPTDALTVAVETPAGRILYSDADIAGLAGLEPSTDGDPVLILRDLTATRLDRVRLGAAATPVLTITRTGGDIAIALEAEQGALASDIAIGLVSEFAARLETPLRQLL